MNIRKSSIINHKSNPPFQYQRGYVEFYKLKFKVSPDVLIPRSETELLVDEILKYYTLNPNPLDNRVIASSAYTLIDLGTGSGNIAISLAKNLASPVVSGKVKIIATDISPKALKVAKQNAKLHGVSDKIKFIQSNLLSNLNYTLYPKPYPHSAEASSAYTLILVTNLPYIPSARISYLDSSVKDFEPLIALDGGGDGFKLYRKLFQQIAQLGWKPKLIIGEIDYTHGELAIQEALKYFPDSNIEVKLDLTHKQRILKITG